MKKSNTHIVNTRNIAGHRASRLWNEFQRRAAVTGVCYKSFRIDLTSHLQAIGANSFVTSWLPGLDAASSVFESPFGIGSGHMPPSLQHWWASEGQLARVRDLREQYLKKMLANRGRDLH